MAEKTPNQQLAEKLLFKPAYAGDKSAAVKQEARAFAEGYKKFLDAGKTEREVAAESERMLKDAGYQQFDPKKTYAPGDKVYFSQLGKAIVASTIGTRSFEDGFHLVIAHTDSPRLDLRPTPLYESAEKKRQPSSGMNALRISFPFSSRIGIFCRFGLLELRRPVAVTVWLKEVCTRPVRGLMSWGSAYNGATPEDGGYLRQTLDTIIEGNKILYPQRSIKDNLPEGYKLLRKLLASQPDNSVVFIAVGPETNLSRLLRSEADEYSPLDGKSLVAQKVKLLSVMGGLYGNEFDFPEWNLVQDINAAQTVFSEWPTPVIASGWELGNKLLYPHQSILNDFPNAYKHPLCVSYQIYDKMPYDRQTWDLTSVIQAIEPEKDYFELSTKGTITIDSAGHSLFNASDKGQHQYLMIQGNENIQRTLGAIVRQVTGKEEKNINQ